MKSTTSPMLLSQLNPDNNLQDALTRLESEVRNAPGSASQRWALAEMLCVMGQWERALKQLQVGAKLVDGKDSPWHAKAQMLRSLIRAEAQRTEVFAGQLLPVPVVDRPFWMEDLARAIAANASGDHGQADSLRSAALEQAPTSAGVCAQQGDGADAQSSTEQAFAWIGDTDTRLGPVFECMLAGGYRWLAFADIASLQVAQPSSLLDLVWLPITLQLCGTQAGAQALRGFVPARYSGTENIAAEIGSSQRDALMLARLTRWQDVGETGVFALGQKTLMGSEGDIPLLGIRSLRMDSDHTQQGSA
ncbi:ImpE protein superfamily protein [Rhodoferax lacus]|uniref:ImpE protein superfamily protein n=1 Tax=Rhodoferax lacus TaxID=2184758 RepID=A0A3E1RB12_9BURK|nr:type VI secretion system accessory protein TagJ [Rhodoferax lacus]RFO96242.1 ImpE protein superfamily protein [Rhodoferax lacus]